MPPPFSQRQAASTSWPARRRLMAGMRSCVAMGSNPPRRPWTRPDLNLLDKPVEMANLRQNRLRKIIVTCGNTGCDHSAELQILPWADDVTINDLQPRMLCTACGHLGADVRPDWLSKV